MFYFCANKIDMKDRLFTDNVGDLSFCFWTEVLCPAQCKC